MSSVAVPSNNAVNPMARERSRRREGGALQAGRGAQDRGGVAREHAEAGSGMEPASLFLIYSG